MFTWSINSSVDVPLPLWRTENRPAIDETNSLVPHSAPSKPPLCAHQHEWVAPLTLEAQDHPFAFTLVRGLCFVVMCANFYFEGLDSFMTDTKEEEVLKMRQR